MNDVAKQIPQSNIPQHSPSLTVDDVLVLAVRLDKAASIAP